MNHAPNPPIWLGTSGLVLPVPNKNHFPKEYQKGTRLTYYASLFNSIEINSSFYKIPKPDTFAKWAAEVPQDFRFTVKLHQSITHAPNLNYPPENLTRFLHAAAQLRDKRGCLLIQFPASIKSNHLESLENLLHAITHIDNTWKIAVEFRHNSWYHPATTALLDRFKATLVLHDMPASKILTPNNPPFTYLRFHGPAGDYKGGYTTSTLEEYAKLIKEWQNAGKEVYVYFNNTIGDAITDQNTLRNML
ncbi:MAG: DUF72 domain-containing protein [Bacteroidetes bacterium]|nr:DUF72 domain-containing protein [Bacteroidota bacterium]